jgi:hypothetical protein
LRGQAGASQHKYRKQLHKFSSRGMLLLKV